MKHAFVFAHVPKGLVRSHTRWGWQAGCVCGWEDDGLWGTKKDAYRAYYRHKNEEGATAHDAKNGSPHEEA